MALVNAFAYTLIDEDLYDKEYVSRYTEGFEEYKKQLVDYSPEAVERIVGVSASEIRQAMHTYAAAKQQPLCGEWG